MTGKPEVMPHQKSDCGKLGSPQLNSVDDVGFVVHLLCHVVSSCDEGLRNPPVESLHKSLEGLRIDPRRLASKLLHILNVEPRINSGTAVRPAFAPQFQHT
jgi:hypothetical protein